MFDYATYTYTYLIADLKSHEALLIDSVLEQVDRDLKVIGELGLKLKYLVETHVHADHITGADRLRQSTGAKVVLGSATKVECADQLIEDQEELVLGERLKVRAIATPGHTDGCTSYFVEGHLMTGDCLFIRSCGRTDFQQGSSERLYHSVHEKLFALPDETRVYPGHDYNGLSVSTIKEERSFNVRLGGGKSLSEFQKIMNELKLPMPQRIHEAVPANLKCGRR